MVRGDLQPARNDRHDGDELTLLGQNQLFFLALVLPLHPDSAESMLKLYIFRNWDIIIVFVVKKNNNNR